MNAVFQSMNMIKFSLPRYQKLTSKANRGGNLDFFDKIEINETERKFTDLVKKRDDSLVKTIETTAKLYDQIFVVAGQIHINNILPRISNQSYHTLIPIETASPDEHLAYVNRF